MNKNRTPQLNFPSRKRKRIQSSKITNEVMKNKATFYKSVYVFLEIEFCIANHRYLITDIVSMHLKDDHIPTE